MEAKAVSAGLVTELIGIFNGHPWIAALLISIAMLLFFLLKILQNAKLLDTLHGVATNHDALAEQVTALEKKVGTNACNNAPTCPNRIKT